MKTFAMVSALLMSIWFCGAVSGEEFLRGDVNGDGRVDPMEDAMALLDYAFRGADAPPCIESSDANNNNAVNLLGDTMFILNWGFNGGAEPPSPGVDECGEDDVGTLGCETPSAECPAEELALEEDGRVVLSIGSRTVNSATTDAVKVAVSIENGGPEIRAFQFGICHDPDIVCVLEEGIVQSTVLLAANDDDGPDFFAVTTTNGAWGVAGLGQLAGNEEFIREGDSGDLVEVTYAIMGEGSTDLSFCDYPTEREWPVRMYTFDGPALPTTANGSITVNAFDGEGDCEATIDVDGCTVNGGEGEYTFDIGNAIGGVGSTVQVPVDLTVAGSCIIAWTFGVCFDPAHLVYESGGRGDDIDDLENASFFAVDSHAEGNVITACVYDLIGEHFLEESNTPYEVLEIDFEVQGGVSSTTLTICDGQLDGLDPLPPGVVQENGDYGPDATYDDGIVYFGSGLVTVIPSLSFQRGDVNGDGDLVALADGIFLLTWVFLGGPEPGCRDAADINDDGTLEALTDAIYLFHYAFLSGNEPPAPIDGCGGDPTADSISCDETSPKCD